MLKALLDTNIIIHRENSAVSNYNIGHLYRWLDKLHYVKVIHPYTIQEIEKYKDDNVQKNFAVKLEAYERIKAIVEPTDDFLKNFTDQDKTINDKIDNALLFYVYSGKVDVLITEDKKLLKKAEEIRIKEKVLSVNQFIIKATEANPALVSYKMLAVKKELFAHIDLSSKFFDSLKKSYKEFADWFNKKSEEEAYVCRDEKDNILGFLYLKVEDANECDDNIIPMLDRKLRLKIGTFKVLSTGFRLGERFIKIIFDNAIQYKVEEIYLTMFEDGEGLHVLADLLISWGFFRYGKKITVNGEETVFVKKLGCYNSSLTVRKNFPNILYNKQKFILPIFPWFHTALLPDSKLNTENEVNFLGREAHKYALQKVYISWSFERNINKGDFVLFYRTGESESNKKYSSVITTLGIITDVIFNFQSKEDFLKHCQNRTVFSPEDLNKFSKKLENLIIIKFIHAKSLAKRPTLGFLWDNNIIKPPNGPRPFTRITDSQFDVILKNAETNINFIKEQNNV
jgi:predicted nucleic acid-binding protein